MSDKKKKKWSRPAKLSLLAGCLILAVGGYVLTTKLVARAEQKEEAASQVAFVSADADDLTALFWSYDGETMPCRRTRMPIGSGRRIRNFRPARRRSAIWNTRWLILPRRGRWRT